jgi:hypothetical protein
LEDPRSDLSRRIELTGWSTVLLGFVCIALSAVQAVIPLLLRRLADVLDSADDPTRAMREAFAAGAGTGALVNGLFGASLIVIGFGVTRRALWSHRALELTGWASIVVLAILAKPTLAPFFALTGGRASPGTGLLAAAAGLVLAQVAAVLWFLRFWRRREVRDAFRSVGT